MNAKAPAWLGALGGALLGGMLAACGGSAAADPAANAGNAGTAGTTGTTGMGASAGDGESAGSSGVGGHADVPVVWNARSEHIDVSCFSYHFGTLLLNGDRAQFSGEQLRSLSNLQRVQANNTCSSDGVSCDILITDDVGNVQKYRADDSNCNGADQALGYDSVKELLASFDCELLTFIENVPLAANAMCQHGVSAGLRKTLSLSEAGKPYHLQLTNCSETAVGLSLQLFGGNPPSLIGTGVPLAAPGPGGACLELDVEVEQPTSADVVIGATSGAVSGWFQFR